jgi:hypothetical protein
MKKFVFFLAIALGVYADAGAWEMPPRFFELGFDVEAGQSNNHFRFDDIFNSSRTLDINLNKMSGKAFALDLLGKGNFFMNVQTRGKHWIGIGIFFGFEGLGFFSLSEGLMDFVGGGNGNFSSFSGEADFAAGIFADTGIKAGFRAGKWRFSIAPAMYVPLLYIPEPDIDLYLSASDPLYGFMRVKGNMYTAIPLDKSSTVGEMLEAKGFDVSLDIAFSALPWFDIGTTLSHIPVYPAVMNHGAEIDKLYEINKEKNKIQDLFDKDGFDNILDPKPDGDDLESFSGARRRVFRPFGFDAYAFLKPAKKDWLVFKPWLGGSVLTVYKNPSFNFGLDIWLKIVNMLNFYYAFGRRDLVWQNSLKLALNLRVLELIAGAGLRSREFSGVWAGAGLYTAVGIRLGF